MTVVAKLTQWPNKHLRNVIISGIKQVAETIHSKTQEDTCKGLNGSPRKAQVLRYVLKGSLTTASSTSIWVAVCSGSAPKAKGGVPNARESSHMPSSHRPSPAAYCCSCCWSPASPGRGAVKALLLAAVGADGRHTCVAAFAAGCCAGGACRCCCCTGLIVSKTACKADFHAEPPFHGYLQNFPYWGPEGCSCKC